MDGRHARELHLSDTAFVVESDSSDVDFELRWFTPEIEVDLCGHATLAAAHCLYHDGVRDPIRFATKSGVLTVGRHTDGALLMDFPVAPAAMTSDAVREAAADALGARVHWSGHTDDSFFLLAQLADERGVREVTPDLAAVAELEATAVIVTAVADHDSDFDFVSRLFAPKAGLPEDPVTGSSHTVLAPFWAERLARTALVGFQASHRPGHVAVELRGDRVLLAGRAVTVVDGVLTDAAVHAAPQH